MSAEEQSFRFRQLSGISRIIQFSLFMILVVLGLSFIMNLHTYLGFAVFSEQWAGVFLTLFLMNTFLSVPPGKRSPLQRVPWYDVILCLLSLPAGLWIAVHFSSIITQLGQVSAERVIVGTLAFLLILEASRRLIGMALVVIVIVFILYGAFSSYLPGLLAGADLSWGRLINYLYLDPNSMLGMLILAATIGLAFVFFGQILLNFGGGDALTNLALLFFGRARGGSAKAAVVGSSLVGTVTGAPMSNVFLTGSITIPLMKRSGYPAHFAGAVEAVASSGGQIMPPVMGIAAFIIAERLGVPYAEVALAALIPALLYYIAVFVQVDLEAGKRKLRGLTKEEMPEVRHTLQQAWPVIPVLLVLVYTIFIARYSPATAAVISGLVAIPILILRRENRTGFWRRLLEALEGTGRMALDLASALAVAGLVVGVISVSGLGFTLGYLLTEFGAHSLFLLLVSAAVGSIILGMGMPSVAAYSLVAVLVGPAMVEFGINEMAAHLFIFYFSIVSNFTPPIALAVFAAATIAQSPPMRTGWTATRLGILAYIVPFLFVYSPSLIMEGSAVDILLSFVTAVVGTVIVGAGLTGYLFASIPWFFRLWAFCAGFMLLIPVSGFGWTALINIIGALLTVLLFAVLYLQRPRKGKPADAEINL